MKRMCSYRLRGRPRACLALLAALLALGGSALATSGEPIRLHPENPHVFLWRGKPTVLVASTEHYGAVMNADFDFRRYLDELQARGLNYTRLFSGVYCEPWGEPFNTLNPPKGRYLAPWARSETLGYADGGNKFDLSRRDNDYFRRLNDFLSEAGRRGVVVELTIFCNWYDENQWRLSPLHTSNNVNGVGDLPFGVVNTLKNGAVLEHQEAVLRKLVTEVNAHDNVFLEICNEPGADGDWMDHMARLVYQTESPLPNRHLIANNGHATPHLSILNAHYDRDASFVRANYARNIVVGYDETGFDGAGERAYRQHGWRCLLNGGGLYDNLDWSFSVAHPDGTETAWNKDLGGGGPAVRQQLGILLRFVNGLALPQMVPDTSMVRAGAPGVVAGLADPGRQYALYLEGSGEATLTLALPAGRYRAEWVNTKTGSTDKAEAFRHAGGERKLASPPYSEDIALRLTNTAPDRVPPSVESVVAVGDRVVRVRFSERVARAGAGAPGNYSIDRRVRVLAATPEPDGRTVLLTTSPLAQGIPYRLTVRKVADRASPPNAVRAGSARSFRYEGSALYRAVNLGGPELAIDGILWEAGGAPGVSFTGSQFENQAVALDPPAEGSRAVMLRSSIWNSQGSNVTLSGVSAGTHKVYLHVWEDNNSQTFDITVNGVRVQQGHPSGAAGHWDRLGPWVVTVTEGTISLRCSPGDANLSGIEVWRSSAPARRGTAMQEKTVPATTSGGVRVGSALRVSANGRHLAHANGKPFFWLGDTAWLLFQMTTREDADLYLKTRAQQGFTVIQAALVMGEERVGGTLRANVYGKLAFQDGDPARPLLTPGKDPGQAEQYDYWNHVDYIIGRAAAHGLTLGLLPLFVGWGGDGYKYLTPDNAYAYGLFLGRRYRSQRHLLWILGGDNTPDTEAKRQAWDQVAKGIATGVSGTEDYARTLMTYHINGNNSSGQWLHAAPWLDLNMAQVWGAEREIYPKLAEDYLRAPVKPTGLGEGSYEDGPQYSTRPIDALKVRRQAYWSYLAGGYHTFGNTNTWNFGTYTGEVTQDWKAALHSPGAASLTVLKRFLTSLEWWKLVPDPSVFAEGEGSGETRNAAARAADGARALVYLSSPCTVSLRMDRIAAPKSCAAWVDPRTGARTAIGDLPTADTRSFTVPDGWPDALLLIEASPGTKRPNHR